MTQAQSSATKWMLGIVAALVFYVLSIGPAQYLSLKYGTSMKSLGWMGTVYAPVYRVCGPHDGVIGGPLGAYLGWWLQLAEKDPKVLGKMCL